jgi:hypothetical protein
MNKMWVPLGLVIALSDVGTVYASGPGHSGYQAPQRVAPPTGPRLPVSTKHWVFHRGVPGVPENPIQPVSDVYAAGSANIASQTAQLVTCVVREVGYCTFANSPPVAAGTKCHCGRLAGMTQ